MNAESLALSLDRAKTVNDTLTLAANVWKEGSELTRQLAAKKIAVPGFGLKDGARLLKLRSDTAKPAEVWDALSPVLPGVTLREFVSKTCDVDPKAVEAMIADKHEVDPKEVYETFLKPLADKNPFEMRQNNPSVIRTGPAPIAAPPAPLPEARPARGAGLSR